MITSHLHLDVSSQQPLKDLLMSSGSVFYYLSLLVSSGFYFSCFLFGCKEATFNLTVKHFSLSWSNIYKQIVGLSVNTANS